MENKRLKQSNKEDNPTPIKLSYSNDSSKTIDLASLELNKPLYDKENSKYSLITFLSSKRKPDVYLNEKVIKARQYRIKQDIEEEENVKESDNESLDMKKKEQRYFNLNLTIKCYNCGEVGHMSRNCPHDEIIVCTRCNEKGHDSFNCTNMKCFKCNGIGHRSFECKNFRNIKQCEKCGHNGHVGEDCLSKPDDITKESRIRTCRFCGEDTHLLCPFPRKMYMIQEYDSDNVIFTDNEDGEVSVKRERKKEKQCPRCGGDHMLSRCKVRPPDNSFDRARDQFKRNQDYGRQHKVSRKSYRSDSEESFKHFSRKDKRRDDYRFNYFK
jgi:hypothetical protein